MAKVEPQQLMDAGFREEQFGTPANFTVYLQDVIDDAAAVVRMNVGRAAYDAVTDDSSADYIRLRNAERCAAKAELWMRRAAFVDSNAAQGMDNTAYLNRREYLNHASNAQACAAQWIDKFLMGGDGIRDEPATDMAGGVVVTGQFMGGASFRGADRVGC